MKGLSFCKKINKYGIYRIISRLKSSKTNSKGEYLMNLVKKYDYESFLVSLLLPTESRFSAFALRAFNVELAQIRDIVSNQTVGQMRLQFWKDSLEEIYKNGQIRETPVMTSLAYAVRKHNLSKRWLINLIESREEILEDRPYRSIQEVEEYSDKTTTSMNYLILQILGVKDINADHAASHLGKAQGLVTLVRSVPYSAQKNRVLLPLDLLIKHNVSQQDVIRGKREQKMKDLIYDLTSEAHIHLETARSFRKDVPKNAIPAMLPIVCCEAYLKAIQKVDFDVFDGRLHQRNNWLPLLLWWQKRKKTF